MKLFHAAKPFLISSTINKKLTAARDGKKLNLFA